MTKEDIDKTISVLKDNAKKLSDRELLESIYIMLQLNDLNTIHNDLKVLSIPTSPMFNNPFL